MSEPGSHESRVPLPAALRYAEREHSRGVMQKILIVIDSREAIGPCLEKASRIAASSGSAIELWARDVEPEFPGSWAGGYRSKEYRKLLRKRRNEEIQDRLATLRQHGLDVTVSVEWDLQATSSLSERVVRSNADLVVCAHPSAISRRAELNSSQLELLHNIAAPLLFVTAGSWRDHPVVSAALDPCHSAERPVLLDRDVYSRACTLAASLGGRVEVLHVFEGVPHFPGERVSKDEQAVAESRARQAIADILCPQSASPSNVRLMTGRMPGRLLEILRESAPDVLVVGSAARHRLPHARLGATVSEVLGYASCDVMIVKPPGFVSPLLVRA